MMHCAHLSFSGSFGGREKVAFSLAEALSGQLHTRLYLVLEERADAAARSDLLEHLAQFKVPVTVLTTSGVFSRQTLQELADNFAQDEICIVHSHCHKSMLYALLIKLWKGLSYATVVTLHGLIIPLSLKGMVHHGINLLGLLLTDGIIGCSARELSSVLNRLPFLARKFTVIRNNLVPALEVPHEHELVRASFRNKFKIPAAKKVLIGNASRLTKVKNIPLFLRTAQAVIQQSARADLLFVVAGDGELRDGLIEMAVELGLGDSLLFVGFLTQMREFYHAIDLFVLTSDSEGTPMALLEAMSVGLPVVASGVGGVPEIVSDGITGYLFPKRDLSACTAAIKDLIQDTGKAAVMGAAGRRRIREEFTPEIWVSRHLEFYHKQIQKQLGNCR